MLIAAFALSLAGAGSAFPPAAAAEAKPANPFAAAVSAIIDAPEFKPAQWGLLVVDIDSGEVVFEKNADKLFAPASTTKLYSCAAAASVLGFDYRFKTPIYTTSKPNEAGVISGDLILVAQGDLTLGGRAEEADKIAFTTGDHTYSNFLSRTVLTTADPLAGLDKLAEQVKKSGINHVQGEVIVDDRLFDHAQSSGSGPETVTPIIVNDNMIDFTVTPGEAGQPASVDWRPKGQAIVVDASVGTVPADQPQSLNISRLAPNRYMIRGQLHVGAKPQIVSRETADPTSTARMFLIEALRRAGVKVDASPLADNPAARLPSVEAYRTYPKAAELESAPLSENLKLILKVSHNLHASTLPLLLAVEKGDRTLSAGLRREAAALAELGVDTSTISFSGGAGGGRGDFVTPRATVQLLCGLSGRKDFNKFRDALPILGVDGTLADAVDADSPARGHVHAKTGTLVMENGLTGGMLMTSKALAGYITDARGRKRAFAFFVNNVPMATSGEARRIGRLLARLSELFYNGAAPAP